VGRLAEFCRLYPVAQSAGATLHLGSGVATPHLATGGSQSLFGGDLLAHGCLAPDLCLPDVCRWPDAVFSGLAVLDIGANFLGQLWLMPYFLFRQPRPTFSGDLDEWLTWLDHRSTGAGLLAIAIALVTYALTTGDWANFVDQFQQRASPDHPRLAVDGVGVSLLWVAF